MRQSKHNAQDPLAEKYMGYSPYNYCKNDPIDNLDPNGLWDIKVSASSDRKKNPYASMTVTDRHGNEIYKTVVKVRGLGRNRKTVNADTPTGIYEMTGWMTNKDTNAFGPNPYIRLNYNEGEAANLRDLLRIHGGRNQKELSDTNGCVRIADEDIKELKDLTDWLESVDGNEKMGRVIIENDLDEHIDYSQRDEIKSSLVLNGGKLNTVTITAPRKSNSNNSNSLWKQLIDYIF